MKFFFLSLFLSSSLVAGKKISCAELTDEFCDNLWSAKNQGNLTGDGYKILMGAREKSDVRQSEWIEVQSYLDHLDDFPEDFRHRFSILAKKIQAHMHNERLDRVWLDKFEDFKVQIDHVVQETANERTYSKYPAYRKKRRGDLSQVDFSQFAVELYNLRNHLLEIRYEKSPQWLRVKNVFKLVRQEMLNFSQTLPEEIRNWARERILATRLSLPYYDPRGVDSEKVCSRSDTAFYYRKFEKIAVCPGRFNMLQDEADLFWLLGHELAHAFDPSGWWENRALETEVGPILREFCSPPKSLMACDRWDLMKKSLTSSKPRPISPTPYDRLNDCLVSRKDLEPFDPSSLESISRRLSRQAISRYAEGNDFTRLVQPTENRYGKVHPNEYFFNVSALRMRYNSDVESEACDPFSYLPELFVQTAKCKKSFNATASKSRAIGFRAVLDETRELDTLIRRLIYSSCGRDCEDLQDEGLSLVASENFADWVSARIFSRRMAQIPSTQERRSWIIRATAKQCLRPSSLREAPDLTEVEKSFSMEIHPDRRLRRLAIFTPEIVKLANCEPTKELDDAGTQCNF